MPVCADSRCLQKQSLCPVWSCQYAEPDVPLELQVKPTGGPGVKIKAVTLATAVQEVHKLMKEDKKVTILKTLQVSLASCCVPWL